jgi:hypothetical protein
MHPDDGMVRLHRLPPHKLAVLPRPVRLRIARMLRPQTLQQLLDGVAKALIGDCLGRPACITARRRDGKECQDRDAGGLVLVGDVRVVARRRELCGARLRAVEVVGAEVDVVEFDVVLYVGAYGVDV